MLLTTPLPDEFTRGHLGRFCCLNSHTNLETTSKTLLHSFCSEHKSLSTHTRLIYALANLSDMNVHQYIQQHTLEPFLRVTTVCTKPPDVYGMISNRIHIKSAYPIRPAAYYCDECCENDLDVYGFTYWRRRHQLPGIDLCLQHGKPLKYVYGTNCFQYTPDSWPNNANNTLSQHNDVSDVILRYATIASHFLDRIKPLPAYLASNRLYKRISELGSRVNDSQTTFKLSSYIASAFPQLWLLSHFPHLAGLLNHEHHTIIDTIVNEPKEAAGEIYALLLAALYEDSTEAINQFTNQNI